MGQVGFGQPDNGIIQMAYVVADLHAAIEQWCRTLRVGPWFVLEHFTGDGSRLPRTALARGGAPGDGLSPVT